MNKTLKELLDSTPKVELTRFIFAKPIRLNEKNTYLELIGGCMPYEIESTNFPGVGILVRRYISREDQSQEECIAFVCLYNKNYCYAERPDPQIEELFIEPTGYNPDLPFKDQFELFEEMWKNIQDFG